MAVNSDDFRKVMGNFVTGVTIVTIQDQEGNPYGLTVNAFTSVSLNPLLVLVCLSDQLSGRELFQKKSQFAVNILAQNQQDLADHFSKSGTDRSQGPYTTGKTGVPVLEGVLARLECELVSEYPGGDHTIVLGEVKSAEVIAAAWKKRPLLFLRGTYQEL